MSLKNVFFKPILSERNFDEKLEEKFEEVNKVIETKEVPFATNDLPVENETVNEDVIPEYMQGIEEVINGNIIEPVEENNEEGLETEEHIEEVASEESEYNSEEVLEPNENTLEPITEDVINEDIPVAPFSEEEMMLNNELVSVGVVEPNEDETEKHVEINISDEVKDKIKRYVEDNSQEVVKSILEILAEGK